MSQPSRRTSLRHKIVTFFADGGQPSWLGSRLNILLVFIPLVSHYLNWAAWLRFGFSFVAIIPLSKLLGEATEWLALECGQILRGRLNVTFGNAIEIIVCVVALVQGQLRIIQTSVVGSILSNFLLALRNIFLASGLKHKEDRLQQTTNPKHLNATEARAGSSQATSTRPEVQSSPNRNSTSTKLCDTIIITPTTISRKPKVGGKDVLEDLHSGEIIRVEPDNDTTDPTPFLHQPLRLASLVDPKNLDALIGLGGIDNLINGLGSDRVRGLPAASTTPCHSPQSGETNAFNAPLEERQRVYGTNVLPTRPSKSLLQLMWLALKDKVLALLSIAAVVSLALALYSNFGTEHSPIQCPDTGLFECKEPQVDWVEGVAIMVAVLIVVIVGSLNDWQKERQFRALNDKKEDRTVKVIRDGKECIIQIKDIVVGDIGLLEPGDIIPCDGVFLRGHNVRCDESGATGESDAIKKFTYEQCLEEKEDATPGARLKRDCFLISGAKVLEGVGDYIVIAIGPKSFNGRIMMALREDIENTALQVKLNALAELIAKLGSLAGFILFSALMIKFFVNLANKPHRTSNEKAIDFVNILIISVTLIVVAVPEGLPLAITLALAFATKRMTGENLLVRVFGSCETMSNASVVCTDKTGTVTQNVMVVAGSVGIHGKFAQHLDKNKERHNVGRVQDDDQAGNRRHASDFAIDMADLNDALSSPLRSLFNESLCINSTAFLDKDPISGEFEFVGSKTETALLRFAKDLGWEDHKVVRDAAQTVQMIPFSSERKCMGVVVKTREGKTRLYVKGASEILTAQCKRHVVVNQPGTSQTDSKNPNEIVAQLIDDSGRENIDRTIIFYANQSLRTIGVCYRDFESWPPAEYKRDATADNNDVPFDILFKDLTLIAITAIEDPLRPGVREAVKDCHGAGVITKVCTGDNVLTARSIATQCGIYTTGGIIMEGPFRKLSDQQKTDIVPRPQVLARSSPEVKKILVEKLKSLGEIVGVTGDGTNDGPALKTANVGFSMGIAGTEVAKEASDIILMDDNFASIVSAIMRGRCVNDSVRKFLQFQISVNITAVLITFVSAVASDEEESVLTAVQLLWINIIMGTSTALALAIDPTRRDRLGPISGRETTPLSNRDMCKQVAIQSLYQLIIALLAHLGGDMIFPDDRSTRGVTQNARWGAEMKVLVFNAFTFCQIFNSINSRRIDKEKNIFHGILRSPYFIGITLLGVVAQVSIIFDDGAAFGVSHISSRSWGISVAFGFIPLLFNFLINLTFNGPIKRLFIRIFIAIGLMVDPNAPLPAVNSDVKIQNWNGAVDTVRKNLTTFAQIRGGRLQSSSFALKSRSARRQAGVQSANSTSTEGNTNTLTPKAISATTKVGGKDTLEDLHSGEVIYVEPGNDTTNPKKPPADKVAHIDPDSDTTDPAPFLHRPLRLTSLVDPKNLDTLIKLGDIDNLINGLGSDRVRGLPAASTTSYHPPQSSEANAFDALLEGRKRVYGTNVLPTRRSKTLLQLMWLALKDKVLVLLCIVAVVSLALGLYSNFGIEQPPIQCPDTGLYECKKPQVEWVEGVAIMVAVLIVVIVGSLNDWQKERQFKALNDKKGDHTIKVVRDGKERMINTKDILVGDIGLLEPGEIIPCDDVFLKAHKHEDHLTNLSTDEQKQGVVNALTEGAVPKPYTTNDTLPTGTVDSPMPITKLEELVVANEITSRELNPAIPPSPPLYPTNSHQSPAQLTSLDSPISVVNDITSLVCIQDDEPVGGGGFCDLYLGHHQSWGKVAMKKPRLRYDDTTIIRRFRREVDIWCSISHPYILPFLGTCMIDSGVYMVSPFIDNGDLSRCIRNGMILDRAKLLSQVASAIAHLHSLEIIHGDIKAQNILLSNDKSPRLCDFGTAKSFRTMVTSSELKGGGSRRWMAPELFDNEPKTKKSDVYAFGMTIAEVLSGNPPLSHIRDYAVITQVLKYDARPLREPLESPDGQPFDYLWEIAEKCWARGPEDRPFMNDLLIPLSPTS